MACDNCQGTQGWYCPICAPTPPAKPAVCEICHDATCPCGKVVLRTDAELIDALRDCRWILAQKVNSDRWIPVGERLPGYEEECVITDGRTCKNAWYGGRDDGFYYDGPKLATTHWRPLPAAPEASNG